MKDNGFYFQSEKFPDGVFITFFIEDEDGSVNNLEAWTDSSCTECANHLLGDDDLDDVVEAALDHQQKVNEYHRRNDSPY